MTLRDFQNWNEFHAKRWMVVIAFLLPLSTSLTEIAIAAGFLQWLATGHFRERWAEIRNQPVILALFSLFLLSVIGLCYGPASWQAALKDLTKQRKFLFAAMFFCLFQDAIVRQRTLRAFQCGMLISLVGSTLLWLGVFPTWQNFEIYSYAPFKVYITHSIMMAFFAYTLVADWKAHPRYRGVLSGLITLAMLNILVMLPARSGWLVLFALVGLVMLQQWSWRGLAVASLFAAVTVALTYESSTTFRNRFEGVFKEYALYISSQKTKFRTSVGERIQYYRTSWEIGCRNPIFGSGTGGYRQEYLKLAREQKLVMSANPHNQFLLMFAEYGIVGVALLIGIFAMILRNARTLSSEGKFLLQGIWATIVVGSLLNSLLLDVTESLLFVLMVSWSYATARSTANSEQESTEDSTEPVQQELLQAA